MKILQFKKKIPTEYQECKCFWDWCSLNFIINDSAFHIVNEGRRSLSQGSLLKRIGLRRGVSDYFIPIMRGGFGGLWIEMKRADKKLSRVSPYQAEWREKMISNGYAAYICYGAQEGITVVLNYLSEKIKKGSLDD